MIWIIINAKLKKLLLNHYQSKNVKFVSLLYHKGYIIKIFTARYMGRSKENISLPKKRGFSLTVNQLKKWDVNYHFLILAKPTYDIFIDDKNLRYKDNWGNELLKKIGIK